MPGRKFQYLLFSRVVVRKKALQAVVLLPQIAKRVKFVYGKENLR